MTHATLGGSIVVAPRACGHDHHRGWCGCCQRAQKVRWEAQLAQVSRQTGHLHALGREAAALPHSLAA